jgi:hypothetical protein
MKGSMFYESLTLCGHYLHGQALRNVEGMQAENCTTPFFHSIDRGLVGKCIVSLGYKTCMQEHRYCFVQLYKYRALLGVSNLFHFTSYMHGKMINWPLQKVCSLSILNWCSKPTSYEPNAARKLP